MVDAGFLLLSIVVWKERCVAIDARKKIMRLFSSFPFSQTREGLAASKRNDACRNRLRSKDILGFEKMTFEIEEKNEKDVRPRTSSKNASLFRKRRNGQTSLMAVRCTVRIHTLRPYLISRRNSGKQLSSFPPRAVTMDGNGHNRTQNAFHLFSSFSFS